MNGGLGHNSALYTGRGTTWDNEMNFVMNHDPSAGSIARPVDQQPSALPLSYGRPQQIMMFCGKIKRIALWGRLNQCMNYFAVLPNLTQTFLYVYTVVYITPSFPITRN